MRVAFIGMGRMGRPMASNVARGGHDLVIYNRTASRAEDLASELGAASASTPGQAAEGADAVITMLPDVDTLRDVYPGPDGVLTALRPEAVAIDMGTTGPSGVRWLDEEVRGVGSTLVDAPVSGSTSMANEGTLTIMAGGPDEAIDRVEPVLLSIGARVYRLGPTGSGAAMKLAVNSVIYALAQAVSEALVLAERSGIDRELAYDVFEHSAVAAPMITYRHEQYVRPAEAPVLFAMDLALKDLRLIDELAAELGSPMPQSRVNLESYGRGVNEGFGGHDMAAVAELLRGSRP